MLHWFNPLVWYGFYRMRQDGEVACDALVLSRFDPAERVSYGHTMIKLAAAGGGTRPVLLPGLAGIVEEESQIKRRVTMISRFKKSTLALTTSGIILLAGLAVFFLTSARSDDTTPYDLGSPGKMIIYHEGAALHVDGNTDGFAELWEAAKAAIRAGRFDSMYACIFPDGDIDAYMAENKETNGLEIIYDEPLELDFTERIVHRIFIDVGNAYFFTSENRQDAYRDGAYCIKPEIVGLRAALVDFISADPVDVDADTDTYEIILKSEDEAKGTVSGGGSYRKGEWVPAEAEPKEGYVFAGWLAVTEDREYIVNRESYTFSAEEDLELVALFYNAAEAQFDWVPGYPPQLSPDRKHLLGWHNEELVLYKYPEKELVERYTFGDIYTITIPHHAWHPRGDAFIYFEESEQQVHLYLVNLNGDRKKIISFSRARYDLAKTSFEGIDCRVGWLAWALEGEAVAVKTRSEEANSLYLVGLDGKILLQKELAEPFYLRSPLTSNDGRQIAFTLYDLSAGEEDLWIWDLGNGALLQVTDDNEGNYPNYWLDRNTLMVRVGGISTGGGHYHGLAAINMQTGERVFEYYMVIDPETGERELTLSKKEDYPQAIFNTMGVSPDGSLMVTVDRCGAGTGARTSIIELGSGEQDYIMENRGVFQVIWESEGQFILNTDGWSNEEDCYTRYEDHFAIKRYSAEEGLTDLVESLKRLYFLGIEQGEIHYLKQVGAYWSWQIFAY